MVTEKVRRFGGMIIKNLSCMEPMNLGYFHAQFLFYTCLIDRNLFFFTLGWIVKRYFNVTILYKAKEENIFTSRLISSKGSFLPVVKNMSLLLSNLFMLMATPSLFAWSKEHPRTRKNIILIKFFETLFQNII